MEEGIGMNYALLKIAGGIGSFAFAWSAGWIAFTFFLIGAGVCFLTAFLGNLDMKERMWHAGFQLGSAGFLVILALFSFLPIPGTKIFFGILLGYVFAGAVFWSSMIISEKEEKKHE